MKSSNWDSNPFEQFKNSSEYYQKLYHYWDQHLGQNKFKHHHHQNHCRCQDKFKHHHHHDHCHGQDNFKHHHHHDHCHSQGNFKHHHHHDHCRCQDENPLMGAQNKKVTINDFGVWGITYTISLNGVPVESASFFTLTGIAGFTQGFPPFPIFETKQGELNKDGTVKSGTGFSVIHEKGSGTYTVYFDEPFIGLQETQKPKVIPENDPQAGAPCNILATSNTISGIVRADGTRFIGAGFKSEKLSLGYYQVTFVPEVNDFNAALMQFITATPIPGFLNLPDNPKVTLLQADKTGFVYHTTAEDRGVEKDWDFPVTFSALHT